MTMRCDQLQGFEQFLAVQEEWTALLKASHQESVFLTHEWFSTWWKHLYADHKLEVLLFRNAEGILVGAAPMMRKADALMFMASEEVTDYCDFLSLPDYRERFYRALVRALKEQLPGISEFRFINIKTGSPTLIHLPPLASEHGMACTVDKTEVAPALSLPSTYEAYLASLRKKDRHELRRKLRRFQSLEGIKFLRVGREDLILPTVESFIKLHEQSRPDKETFWQTRGMKPFFMELMTRFSANGWAELLSVERSDRMIAGMLIFSYRDEVLLYNMAYDPEYAKYSVGFFLFDRAIRQAIAENKLLVDFLRGSEKYKYYFGAKDSKIYMLSLHAKETQR